MHIAQVGPYALPDLPGLPRFIDLVKGKKDKTMVEFLHLTAIIGRALHAPPGVPANRVTALRRAFDATVKDPAFLADFKNRKLPVGPTNGEKLQAFIEKVIATPKSTVNELKAALK